MCQSWQLQYRFYIFMSPHNDIELYVKTCIFFILFYLRPIFIIRQGMLEPTKDAVPALCSTGYPAREPPGPQDIPHPSTGSVQVNPFELV